MGFDCDLRKVSEHTDVWFSLQNLAGVHESAKMHMDGLEAIVNSRGGLRGIGSSSKHLIRRQAAWSEPPFSDQIIRFLTILNQKERYLCRHPPRNLPPLWARLPRRKRPRMASLQLPSYSLPLQTDKPHRQTFPKFRDYRSLLESPKSLSAERKGNFTWQWIYRDFPG